MSNVRIMIVEDEWVVSDDLQRSLKRLGYTVSSVVGYGENAVKKAGEDRPDLILMDIMLKGKMDGIEAASQIHSRFNIPIIYLTAYDNKAALERAKITEPFGYMIKPFQERELHTTIEMALYKHEAEEKNYKLVHQLTESEAKYSQIHSDSFDCIILANTEGVIVEVNKMTKKTFGYEVSEILGENIVKLMPEHFRKKHVGGIKRVLETGKSKSLGTLLAFEGLRKNGKIFPIELVVNSFSVNGSIYFTGTLRDITRRKQMEARLERLATTDRLTQAYNRLKFEDIIKREIEMVKRHNLPLSILMFDVDLFKNINDSYGHIAGDYVLKTIANIAKKNIREIDYLVRWGGEEFLIIAPDTTLEKAKALAERIRKAIEDYRFDGIEKVTASFGTTNFTIEDTVNTFIKRVDDAMYHAKAKGRNNVVVNV